MSTDLYWRPAPKDVPSGEDLPYALKKALARRLWGHDGSLRGGHIEVGKEIVPYLEGLADGGVEGAAQLINLIRAHDVVELWIE